MTVATSAYRLNRSSTIRWTWCASTIFTIGSTLTGHGGLLKLIWFAWSSLRFLGSVLFGRRHICVFGSTLSLTMLLSIHSQTRKHEEPICFRESSSGSFNISKSSSTTRPCLASIMVTWSMGCCNPSRLPLSSWTPKWHVCRKYHWSLGANQFWISRNMVYTVNSVAAYYPFSRYATNRLINAQNVKKSKGRNKITKTTTYIA